jgi:hypothetical protein
MIGKILVLALSALPLTCMAETYLCVGEAGAAVEHGGAAGIKSGLYDVSKAKYVLSDSSGSWQFKQLGQDRSPLECISQYYCEVKSGFSSFFLREPESNVFTYVSVVAFEPDFKRSVLYTVKGTCSKL